jgi:putative serine protease PepD
MQAPRPVADPDRPARAGPIHRLVAAPDGAVREVPPAAPWRPDRDEPTPPVAPPRPRRRLAIGTLLVVVALVSGLIGGLVGAVATRELEASGPTASTISASDQRATAQPAAPGPTPSADRVQGIAAAVLPAVVQVEASSFEGKSTGSGVIVSKDGYVLTNAHVVEGVSSASVMLSTAEPLKARVIGRDPVNDLAVLRVRRPGLPVATFGRSSDLRVGEPAIAVGSPFGFQGTVTAGIVSALHRVVRVPDSEGVGIRRELVDAIQTDTAINPGNSGGALANGVGQVVGIVTAIATNGQAESNAGIGFAIPIDEAREVVAALIAHKKVRVPFVGMQAEELTADDVARYRLQGRSGALVGSVQSRGPAAAAGLRKGDLVVRFADQPVGTTDQLKVAVRLATIGRSVPIVVVRRGRELALRITPTSEPRS